MALCVLKKSKKEIFGVLNSNTISWIEKCSEEIKSYNRKSRVYPYLLDERLYIVNSTSCSQNIEISHTNKHSFVKMKRIINELRGKEYCSLQPQNWVNIYKKPLFNNKAKRRKPLMVYSITKTLDILATNIAKKNLRNSSMNNLRQYSSIHGALHNIEYKWQLYGSIYQGIIPCLIHPEIIIRIVRTIVHDVAFIHLFRELLYPSSLKHRVTQDINILGLSQINSFRILLFNWYILEYEKFFCIELPRVLFPSYSLTNNKDSDVSTKKKMTVWQSSVFSEKQKLADKNSHHHVNPTDRHAQVISNIEKRRIHNIYQYIRAKNLAFLNLETTQQNIALVHKRYRNFLQYRLGYTNEISCWAYKCGDNAYIFLGYIVQFKTRQISLRIDINSYKVRTYVLNKAIVILNPLFWIIRILAIYRFCTSCGYPISKSGWSTYSDLVIVDRFKRIKDSLVKYYSGSLNQKDLSKINHILHYSCAKTLACKHKTNLKKIWKKYGKNLSIRYPGKSRKSLQMSRTKNYDNARINIRFWNFYYQKADPMSIMLEKRYRLSNK